MNKTSPAFLLTLLSAGIAANISPANAASDLSGLFQRARGAIHGFRPASLKSDDREWAKLIERVMPSVVSIQTTAKPTMVGFVNGAMLTATPADLGGSGFIIEKVGNKLLIITNAHVIETAGSTVITMPGNQKAPGKILGYNKAYDLGFIEVDAACAQCAQAKLYGEGRSHETGKNVIKTGHKVIAIGSPFGLEGTVTRGIISALDRNLNKINQRVGVIDDYIQTDAAINQGNSGGPLVNIDGYVIGINNQAIDLAGKTGIGFAIPIKYAIKIRDRYKRTGIIASARFGAGLLDDEAAGRVVVHYFEWNSPALISGFRMGDIILALDGKKPASASDLLRMIADKLPGDKVEIKYIRNGIEQPPVTVTLDGN